VNILTVFSALCEFVCVLFHAASALYTVSQKRIPDIIDYNSKEDK